MNRLGAAFFYLWVLLGLARGQGEGVFADFTTALGNFTVQLDYERAPLAVASFVGLATGEGSWADPQGNIWTNRPFYDGSIFHRVVKDFGTGAGVAIQAGGIAGVSAGITNFTNAGYTMLDSVTNGLAHSNGVISLANSGPNTDGSQFFITATNWPAWNGIHTVFGRVTTGMEVVAAIAAVAVQGEGERPLADVALHSVNIQRVGAAAQAFDIAAQGVPVAESGPMRHYTAGTNQMLEFEIGSQTEMRFRESRDLQDWETSYWGIHTGDTVLWTAPPVPRVELGNTYFFHMSRIYYPTPVTSPASQRARTFTFWWDVPALKYVVTFAANWMVQGDYLVTQGTNAPVGGKVFTLDTWRRQPYSGVLEFVDDSGKEFSYALGFNPGQATNRFRGTVVISTNAPIPISGVFTTSL